VTFDECFTLLLRDEGGYVDHPRDPGGATNFGVTRKAWSQWVGRSANKDAIRALTPERVKPFYFARYWMPVQGNNLPSGLDYAVFDTAVNSGVSRASAILQDVCGVEVDYRIGPVTVAAARNTSDVINKFLDARRQFLEDLPGWETFGKGWRARIGRVRHVANLAAHPPT
jgi:lysozyme family protein